MSYKRFRDDVPKEIVDEIYNQQDSNIYYVYRAIFYDSNKTVEKDFLPYYLSNDKYIPEYLLRCSDYGMSVFKDLEKLKSTVASSKTELHDKTIAYAFGRTNFDRGIWTAPNRMTHLEYYLFDWENNNPCADFEIIEKDEKEQNAE